MKCLLIIWNWRRTEIPVFDMFSVKQTHKVGVKFMHLVLEQILKYICREVFCIKVLLLAHKYWRTFHFWFYRFFLVGLTWSRSSKVVKSESNSVCIYKKEWLWRWFWLFFLLIKKTLKFKKITSYDMLPRFRCRKSDLAFLKV